MKLRKGHVRITAGDHLGKITMHNAEATEKVRCFRGDRASAADFPISSCTAARYRAQDSASSTNQVMQSVRRCVLHRLGHKSRVDCPYGQAGQIPDFSRRNAPEAQSLRAAATAATERVRPSRNRDRSRSFGSPRASGCPAQFLRCGSFHHDRLGEGHHYNIVQVENSVLRLGLGP